MIWKSKEFLTILVDLIVSVALYFGAKYLAPESFEDVKWVIAALQPIALFLIAWFTAERIKADVQQIFYEALGRR